MDRVDAKLALDLGSNFYGQGNLKKSLLYYEKALNLFKKTKDFQNEADTLLEMGDVYIKLNNPEEAQKYYKLSLSLYSYNNDVIGEAYALTGLGTVFERYEKYEEARNYYEKSIKKFLKAKDFKRAGLVSNFIANTYKLQDAVEYAVMDYRRSLELFEKIADDERKADAKMAIVSLESRRSKYKSSKEIIILVTYLIAIVAAEIETAYYGVYVGLGMHAIILMALLINSSIHESYNFSNLLRSMMILPIIRIIGLSMPIMQVEHLYWFPIIAIPLFAASFMFVRIQRLNIKKIGLVLGNIPVQLFIALSGVIFGVVEYLILKPQPLISSFSWEMVLIGGIILIISTGFAEELLFRGILQKNAENVFGNIYGLMYASILFTALHIGWKSTLDLLFVFWVAIFYGFMFQKTRSLFGITLSHGISNTFLFLIMPFIFPTLMFYIK